MVAAPQRVTPARLQDDGERNMKTASLALLILVGLFGVIVPLNRPAPGIEPAAVVQQESAPGSIDAMAQQAISQGIDPITYPILVAHEDVEGFDEAQLNYSVVVARALSKQSLAISPYTIETWFRFELTEVLSAKSPHLCVGGACAIPAEVAPPGGNEILVPRAGGSVFRNGVTVNLEWAEFPDFTAGQTYVLFLDYDAGARVGVPAMGPVGVFLVDAYGRMSPVFNEDTGLREDLAVRFGNNLNQLRSVLNPQPQPTCEPETEQNCYNNLGEWNPSLCQCTLPPQPDREPCGPWGCTQ